MRLTRPVSTTIITIIVVSLGWYLHAHSDFSNDDLDNFLLMQRTSFWQFLMMPVDVHYAPLHRLLSYLVYHMAPMNFSVAIVIVLACHAATILLLIRTLHVLQTGRFGEVIVCAYASSALVVYGLVWWAHAQHRAPYVLLDTCAIYNYVMWVKSGQRIRLLYVTVSFLLALGFYTKAVFIPLHILCVGYLADEEQFRINARKLIQPPVLLLMASAMYVATYLAFHHAVTSSPFDAIRADLEFAKVFLATAFGFSTQDCHDISAHGMSLPLLCLILTGGVVIMISWWRGRGSWKPLLAGFLILMLDFLPIAASNRNTVWSDYLGMHQTRYGYEELHLFALLVGIWSVRVGIATAQGVYGRMMWLIGLALVVLYAGTNAAYVRWALQPASGLTPLSMMDQSHLYFRNLRAGLSQIPGSAPVFENDPIPRCLSVFQLIPDTRTMLPLFLRDARFDEGASPRYQVQLDGHIALIQ